MRVIYHPDAEGELIQAAQFYEERVPTLGAQFLEAADRAILLISEAPGQWRIIEKNVRRYSMPRFPYANLLSRLRPSSHSRFQTSPPPSRLLALRLRD
jgi:hypothetical protein